MKSVAENLSPVRVKLNVEVPFEELKPYIDQAYKAVAEQIQVPGFRKGKIPSRIIDQRVGKDYVIQEAVNTGLDTFYQTAVEQTGIQPISRPVVENLELPTNKSEEDLTFTIEVDVRPEVSLPDLKNIELTVEATKSDETDIDKALDQLRSRFGTLKTVERPAADGDFTTVNLLAKIDGEQVDSAENLSYEIGSGNMLDGIDEALLGLSAGEDATFETKLAGGERNGEDAQVTVTLSAVKERELPEANDDFAQLASEFDTIGELRESLAKQVDEDKVIAQGLEARDKLTRKLQELIEVPIPEALINDQIEQHFGGPDGTQTGGDHDTEEHRKEVREQTEEAFRNEIILDAIAAADDIQVGEPELIEYIVQMSGQYGMEPNQFAQLIQQSGQLASLVNEVRRRKALSNALDLITVKDSNGEVVDLSVFTRPAQPEQGEQENVEAEVVTTEAEEPDSTEEPEGAQKPAKGKKTASAPKADPSDPANIKF